MANNGCGCGSVCVGCGCPNTTVGQGMAITNRTLSARDTYLSHSPHNQPAADGGLFGHSPHNQPPAPGGRGFVARPESPWRTTGWYHTPARSIVPR